MARKYNMGSLYGMALDPVSDSLTNLLLFIVLIYRTNISTPQIALLGCLSYLLSVAYGLNEAISNYKKYNHDNFYLSYKKLFDGHEKLLYKLFLFLMKISYLSYRALFPKYDQEKINKYLKYIKEFGPGNFTVFIIVLLYSLKHKSL
tara:strand:- start:814 stop:1254 length:441 start_codon:yes stop_codon:yes gene_type:complete